MHFLEYQQAARQFAIYPTTHAIMYPALGLAGEVGETCEKIKKLIRDGTGLGTITNEQRDAVQKELGDVLWYVANLACDLGLNLDEIATTNLEKLRQRKLTGTIKGSGDNRQDSVLLKKELNDGQPRDDWPHGDPDSLLREYEV